MLLVRDDYATCPRYNINKNPTVYENRFYQEIKRLRAEQPSIEKFIPYEYMHGSVEQRIDLLRGLMDTDGSGKKNRITYSTFPMAWHVMSPFWYALLADRQLYAGTTGEMKAKVWSFK